MSLYWLLSEVWPGKKILAVTSCLCAVVYPAFQVQFSSIIYSITFFIFSLFILSLYFSIKMISSANHKHTYLVISLFFSAISLITSEYFFTLELIRYFLIWIYLGKSQTESRLKKTLITSSPFLILYVSTIIWRLFQENKETTYSLVLLKNLKSSLLPTLINQSVKSLNDLWYTAVKIWFDPIYPAHLISHQGKWVVFAYYGLILFIFIVIYIFLKFRVAANNEETYEDNIQNIFIFGFISLFLAGIPFWLAGLPINDKYFFTRWTIPFMIGSCIVIPYSIWIVFKNMRVSIILISILISFAAGTQFLAANSFRHDRENQNKFYWELIWRIPALQENTVLFSDMLNFHYENSDQLSSGINFALANKDKVSAIPYFLFYLPERINTSILPELKMNIPISGKRYYSSFNGSSSQSLIFDFNPPECLKILDPLLDKENPKLSSLTKKALFLSKPNLIFPDEIDKSPQNSIDVIGSEPPHHWCYYFEKADAASQFHNWNSIELLYRDVQKMNYTPRDSREWFPFIEGLAHLSKWEEAANLSDQTLMTSDNMKPMLCLLWKRIAADTSETIQQQLALSKIDHKLGCR